MFKYRNIKIYIDRYKSNGIDTKDIDWDMIRLLHQPFNILNHLLWQIVIAIVLSYQTLALTLTLTLTHPWLDQSGNEIRIDWLNRQRRTEPNEWMEKSEGSLLEQSWMFPMTSADPSMMGRERGMVVTNKVKEKSRTNELFLLLFCSPLKGLKWEKKWWGKREREGKSYKE